jgi:hypothetical protein
MSQMLNDEVSFLLPTVTPNIILIVHFGKQHNQWSKMSQYLFRQIKQA